MIKDYFSLPVKKPGEFYDILTDETTFKFIND